MNSTVKMFQESVGLLKLLRCHAPNGVWRGMCRRADKPRDAARWDVARNQRA